ncbi:MAG: ABC transporter substrate-binding protein, partial [Phaeodactylibacter sp.]|nr:ABC transporter substrate-binding protein [Phaeodactylibacter sp.]
MKKESRKSFLQRSAAGLAGLGLLAATGCADNAAPEKGQAPAILRRKPIRWKMVTTWPPNFPILGEGCSLMAQWVAEMSDGMFEIEVFGGGELVPPLEAFDAVRIGAAQIGNGAGYYWAGKMPAAQFFATVPFGMNAQQMNAWLIHGGGLDLWHEVYEPFGVFSWPAGN